MFIPGVRRKQVLAGIAQRYPKRAVCGITALALILPCTVHAATATGSVAVSASITASCTIGGSTLAFGAYTGAVSNALSTISVNCTNATTYVIAMSAGAGTGATTTVRKMTGPSSSLLNYAMYQDSGRSQNWGSTGGTDTEAGTGTGAAQTLTIYGQIPAAQTSPVAGSYADTVTATLTY